MRFSLPSRVKACTTSKRPTHPRLRRPAEPRLLALPPALSQAVPSPHPAQTRPALAEVMATLPALSPLPSANARRIWAIPTKRALTTTGSRLEPGDLVFHLTCSRHTSSSRKAIQFQRIFAIHSYESTKVAPWLS